jgi:hypothetical protein
VTAVAGLRWGGLIYRNNRAFKAREPPAAGGNRPAARSNRNDIPGVARVGDEKPAAGKGHHKGEKLDT